MDVVNTTQIFRNRVLDRGINPNNWTSLARLLERKDDDWKSTRTGLSI